MGNTFICYSVLNQPYPVPSPINHFSSSAAFVHDDDLLGLRRPNIELLITALLDDASSLVYCPDSMINFTTIEIPSSGVVPFEAQQIGKRPSIRCRLMHTNLAIDFLFISCSNGSIRGCGASGNSMPGRWRHWGHCDVVDNDTGAPSGILILPSITAGIKSWTFATLPSQRKSFYIKHQFGPSSFHQYMYA